MKNSYLKTVSLFLGILVLFNFSQYTFSQEIKKAEDIKKLNEQYFQVLKLMGKKNYHDAIKKSKAIIKKDPTFFRAYKQIVEAYKMKKDLNSAINYFRSLKQKNPDIYCIYFGLGQAYRYMKQYDQAIEQFKKSIELRPNFSISYLGLINTNAMRERKKEKGQSEVELYLKKLREKDPTNACVYFGLGFQYHREHRWEESLSMLNSAIELNPDFTDAYSMKASNFYYKSEFRKVIKLLNIVLELASKNKDIERERRVLGNMGIIHRNLGNYEEALKYNNRALHICREIGNKYREGRHLTNISNVYIDLGDYEKALMYYQEALAINRETGNKWSEEITLANIGSVYHSLGDYPKALIYYGKALAINRETGNKKNEGGILKYIGSANEKLGDYPKALKYHGKALAIYRETEDKKGEGFTLANIGYVYHSLGDYEKALKYYGEALTINRKIGHKQNEVFVLNSFGDLFFKLKNYSQSIKSFNRALSIAQDLGMPSITWGAYSGLGSVYKKQEKHNQALAFYRKSIEVIEDTRAKLQLKEHKAGFFKDKIKVYESLVNLLFEMHQKQPSKDYNQESFYFVEKAKARAFFDSLQEAKIDLKKDFSVEIKEKEYRINRGISRLQTNLLKPNLAEKKEKEIIVKLESLEDQYRNLILRIKRENPAYAGLVFPEPYKLEEIQKRLLSEDTVIIEYFLGKEHSFMFCITSNDFEVKKISSIENLNESVYAYLKLLSSRKEKNFKGVLAAKHLYKELIHPFQNKIKATKNLIIIPDGHLHYLPFETLVAESRNEKSKIHYLIDDYKISYAPSASSLINLLERKRGVKVKKDLLAFAEPVYAIKKTSGAEINAEQILRTFYLEKGFNFSPLKYSGEEVKGIAKLIKKTSRDIYTREEAKEEIVKKLSLTDYKIIHFATHGLLDEEVVGRSGLVLTLDDDPKEDGFFQVREIYNSRLNANLVVLSACQTGKGKLEKGEGVSGLSRAFLYAGAESVLVSLWNINDKSTAQFMTYFYKYLTRGDSKVQALRLAKIKMIQSKYSHPYYWAAFVLIGDFNSPVKISKPSY